MSLSNEKSLKIAALAFALLPLSAHAGTFYNTQTYKCLTEDSEPGIYYQVTFGSDDEGYLAALDFRSYGETLHTGERYNERTFSANARPQLLSDGTIWFPALDFNTTPVSHVNLRIKPIASELKWPLMSGSIEHGSFKAPVTCAYIGVKP